jgi:hypothetical protein
MKLLVTLAVLVALATPTFAATCSDKMIFQVALATEAAQVSIDAKDIGEKHKVKKVETELVASLFWFQIGIQYTGSCKAVKAAIQELFGLGQ